MRFFQVKDWESFQSYRDRRPPWIRLHKSLIDDFKFQKMSADARALLPMLWLIASEDKDPVSGLIRIGYEGVSFRLRRPESEIKNVIDNEIIPSGFLTLLSDEESMSYESVTKTLRIRNTETEAETEERRGDSKKNFKKKGKRNGKSKSDIAREAAYRAVAESG